MDDTKVTEMFENIKRIAQESLVKDGFLMGVIFAMTATEVRLIPCTFSNREEKERFFDTCRKVIRDWGARAAILVVETWVKPATLEEIGEIEELGESASEDSSREEALVFMLETPEYQRLSMVPFTRVGDRIVLGEEEEVRDTDPGLLGLYQPTIQ